LSELQLVTATPQGKKKAAPKKKIYYYKKYIKTNCLLKANKF